VTTPEKTVDIAAIRSELATSPLKGREKLLALCDRVEQLEADNRGLAESMATVTDALLAARADNQRLRDAVNAATELIRQGVEL